MIETAALAFAVVSSVAGATWAIRSKLSDVEALLREHISHDDEKFKSVEGRIAYLEKWRR